MAVSPEARDRTRHPLTAMLASHHSWGHLASGDNKQLYVSPKIGADEDSFKGMPAVPECLILFSGGVRAHFLWVLVLTSPDVQPGGASTVSSPGPSSLTHAQAGLGGVWTFGTEFREDLEVPVTSPRPCQLAFVGFIETLVPIPVRADSVLLM